MPEGDQKFACVAGFTSGGMPFGLTGEESEVIEASEQERQHQCPPAQAKPVSLTELIGEMQMQSEEWLVYYRRSTGEFTGIKDEYVVAIRMAKPFPAN
jgi:hypothetical protein